MKRCRYSIDSHESAISSNKLDRGFRDIKIKNKHVYERRVRASATTFCCADCHPEDHKADQLTSR